MNNSETPSEPQAPLMSQLDLLIKQQVDDRIEERLLELNKINLGKIHTIIDERFDDIQDKLEKERNLMHKKISKALGIKYTPPEIASLEYNNDEVLTWHINKLRLGALTTANVCRGGKVKTIKDLLTMTAEEVQETVGYGKGTAEKINLRLSRYGLSLKGSENAGKTTDTK